MTIRALVAFRLLLLCSALTVGGCASRTPAPHLAAAPAVVRIAQGSAPLFVTQANAALGKADFAAAASFAELAVRAAPADSASRSLLARTYMASGRLRSAGQAYDDLLAQDAANGKARLGRALSRLASGDRAGAIADLDTLGTNAPRADVGLAYALSGETSRGVALLTAAARSAEADARIRQNLALALALDGQWAKARAVAAQDLDAASVELRLREWTALSGAGSPTSRALAFLQVTPNPQDSGRPAALAVIAPEAAPAVAAVAAPVIALPEAKPVEVAVEIAASPLAAAVQPTGFVPAGRWVVQLGAYATEGLLDAAWADMSARNSKLIGAFEPILSLISLPDRGTFHRLAIGGFSERAEAVKLCEALRTHKSQCLVRDAGQAVPMQLAVVRL